MEIKTFKEFMKESMASYTVKPTKKFRVTGPNSFKELQTDPNFKKYMGPKTYVADVSDNERVKKAPGENKWNALFSLYGNDEDEIVCAQGGKAKDGGVEWFCLAVKVEI